MMMKALFVMLPLVLAPACGGSSGGQPIDAGPTDASCFTDPKTYNEIINACTTAVKVYKDSHPPLQNPDGTLPPLP